MLSNQVLERYNNLDFKQIMLILEKNPSKLCSGMLARYYLKCVFWPCIVDQEFDLLRLLSAKSVKKLPWLQGYVNLSNAFKLIHSFNLVNSEALVELKKAELEFSYFNQKAGICIVNDYLPCPAFYNSNV